MGNQIQQELNISDPSNFAHISHVGYSSVSGYEVRNIPQEWIKIFKLIVGVVVQQNAKEPDIQTPTRLENKESLLKHIIRPRNNVTPEFPIDSIEMGNYNIYPVVFQEILLDLNLQDLISCTKVCKKWYIICNLESIWRIKVDRWLLQNNDIFFKALEIVPRVPDMQMVNTLQHQVWKPYYRFLIKELSLYLGEFLMAIESFSAAETDELSFQEGDILAAEGKEIDGWRQASFRNKKGMIPGSYVVEL